jgi:hypothetical protein
MYDLSVLNCLQKEGGDWHKEMLIQDMEDILLLIAGIISICATSLTLWIIYG